MATTEHYAKIAGMLSHEAAYALVMFAARKNASITAAAVRELLGRDLIKQTTNLITNGEIWLITPTGKKVAAHLEVANG